MSLEKSTRSLLTVFNELEGEHKECSKCEETSVIRQAKLVPSARNKPMHNARKASKIRTLGECLLGVKGVKLQRQNDTKLGDDENKDEGLYNELKA